MIVINMKMPTSCGECRFCDYSGDYPRCMLTDEQKGYTFKLYEKMMDKCPIVGEIPNEHGDLIDRDELPVRVGFLLNERFNCVRFDDILSAPVILGATE